MKKRFLDRFTYPYLEKRVPENIVPGRILSKKRIKSLLKTKTLRSSITSESSRQSLESSSRQSLESSSRQSLESCSRQSLESSSRQSLESSSSMERGRVVGDKISNRSPGLWLRLIKPTLRLHKSKLGGEKAPWFRIDTLERGSLASAVDSSSRIKLGDGCPALYDSRPSKVWVKTLLDGGAPALSPKYGVGASQLKGTASIAEGHDSLYSSIQLEEALSRQQERRPSPLLLKLMERNKLRIMYGNIDNRKVDQLIKRGSTARGGMSDNLFKLLESRIDVFLCRVGFLATIPCARQWIHHGKVLINQKITTTASHMLKPGDIVSISTSNLVSLRESLQERSSKISISLRGESVASLPSHGLPPFRGGGKGKQGGIQLPNAPTGVGNPHTVDFSKLVGLASHSNTTRLSLYRPADIARPVPNVARKERLRRFNLKPTCAEISFRCLTAIYLYPPQQVLLPAMVDVEKISKY